jgi:hypothetical protein
VALGVPRIPNRTNNRPVRDWINGLDEDARDELVDILSYMQVRPNSEWHPENFTAIETQLSEIRFGTADHWYRIYGFFWPGRRDYTFLNGTEKKVRNDREGKRLAKERRDRLLRGEASIHPFAIQG